MKTQRIYLVLIFCFCIEKHIKHYFQIIRIVFIEYQNSRTCFDSCFLKLLLRTIFENTTILVIFEITHCYLNLEF